MKTIVPVDEINATVSVPGSKSYTQRALITAALAQGRSVIRDALVSEDTAYLIDALGRLGAGIKQDGATLTVDGTHGKPACPSQRVMMGNNGTGLRLLAGLAALCDGTVIIDGSARMRQRPIQPLMDALRMLGVNAKCLRGNGCPPIQVEGAGIPGGRALLDAGLSSQFLSSLLLAAPYAAKNVIIHLQGPLASQPYVQITIDVMAAFGVRVQQPEETSFSIEVPQTYTPRDYRVEGDVSSATYFMAAAAVCGGTIRIANIGPNSLQGDLRFTEILSAFGCPVRLSEDGLEISGPLSRHEDMCFDLGDVPDMVPALAAVSAFRRGKTSMKNIGHLRVKECDRIAALASELNRIGVTVEEKDDEMTVQGPPTQGGEIACFNDHRIAMSFAVVGLSIPGISITDPACVNKSFPDFWNILDSLSVHATRT